MDRVLAGAYLRLSSPMHMHHSLQYLHRLAPVLESIQRRAELVDLLSSLCKEGLKW